MRIQNRMQTLARAAALIVLGIVTACSGGSGGDAANTGFAISGISVADGATWAINRAIEVRFNAPVNFASVNMGTINIAQVGGPPAVGTFSQDPADPRLIRFQPACPTQADFSDAGLQPSTSTTTVFYQLTILGASTGGATVQSVSGESLSQGQTRTFQTPSASQLSELFIDYVPEAPLPIDPDGTNSSYVELGLDPDQRVFFEDAVEPIEDFDAPLNLYSDVGSKVAIVVKLNQSVNPAPTNINPDTILLEYCNLNCDGPPALAVWEPIPHTVELVSNCTEGGSTIRVTPFGILPQGRNVRIVLTTELTDIVGQSNIVDVPVGAFRVATNPDGLADEVLEEFTVGAESPGSFEDSTSALPEPRAIWSGDRLEAAFAFDGTGGTNGVFDYVVNGTTVLDTDFSVITSSDSQLQQAVVNGRIDVRNLTINPGARLLLQGQSPCRILASGSITINGEIQISGANRFAVATLNTTNQPEIGASGNSGGGRGGAGSFLTTQSTPQGEPGYGAFQFAGGGGGGGESSFNPNGNDELRRPGGGGGGRLGKDALRPSGTTGTPNNGFTVANPVFAGGPLCPDQSLIGLDAEDGFKGWPLVTINPTATPSVTPSGNNGASHPGQQPLGGVRGPRPFVDTNENNDFWGTMVTVGGALIQGELAEPWAGAGGGGGGDAVNSISFPLNPFSPAGDEKGCGGGGGGGSLTILALGPITLGQAGRIVANGGAGGGGENSFTGGGVTHIGGGSGGGSGGHLIVQSATKIDFSACRSSLGGGLYALGGQGGAGAQDVGGWSAQGQSATHLDALPVNAYPSVDAPTAANHLEAPCMMSKGMGVTVYPTTNTRGNVSAAVYVPWHGNDPNTVVACAGGDGGPGIIQIHVPTLATDLVAPVTAGENFYKLIRPYPIGAPVNTINTIATWDRMLPTFGPRSMGQSKWIAMGLATTPAVGTDLDPVEFRFAGTDTTTGLVLKDVAPNEELVLELPPVATGVLDAEPTLPYVTPDFRTIVFSAAGLDELYITNPNLMRRFGLRLFQGSESELFEIASAVFLPSPDRIEATVTAGGQPLEGYVAGDSFEVIPRFFRVSTDGEVDALPASSSIKLEFQATSQTEQGTPVETVSDTGASPWVTDIEDLNSHPNAENFRFFRFRATFDILADLSPLSFTTPIPALDFLRVPFKF